VTGGAADPAPRGQAEIVRGGVDPSEVRLLVSYIKGSMTDILTASDSGSLRGDLLPPGAGTSLVS
jgi:hypothetical protein